MISIKEIIMIMLTVILSFFLISVLFCFGKTILNKIRYKETLKDTIINTKYGKIIDFIKWIIIDTLRGKDFLKLYGIWAFTGYYGEGKTLGCVLYAKHLQEKYPHRDIKIYSNIEIKGQNGKVKNWRDLLELPPNTIVIYDESQSDWSSTLGVRDFPEDLLRKITQVRKKQLAIFMTSPVYTRMNINLRESVNFVIECKNIMQFDRWFRYDFYRAELYEKLMDDPKRKRKEGYLFGESFVVSDDDYTLYDTNEEVKSLKDNDKTEIKNKKNRIYIENYLKVFENEFRNEIIKRVETMIRKNNT